MIIILEDDNNRIKHFSRWFPDGKIVTTAKECIELLRSHKCDLLFLDHDLGGEIFVDTNHKNTGSEVVRWIDDNRPNINEIIIHSYNSPASRDMLSTLLSIGYNAKRLPFSPNWTIKER